MFTNRQVIVQHQPRHAPLPMAKVQNFWQEAPFSAADAKIQQEVILSAHDEMQEQVPLLSRSMMLHGYNAEQEQSVHSEGEQWVRSRQDNDRKHRESIGNSNETYENC